MPTTETIRTAASVLDPQHDNQFTGTPAEAVDAVVRYVAEMRRDHWPDWSTRVARRLVNAQADRVAEVATAALGRLIEAEASRNAFRDMAKARTALAGRLADELRRHVGEDEVRRLWRAGHGAPDASPWPLAEGDKVRIDVEATVVDVPDPEDEPGEGFYTFAIESRHVNGGRMWLPGLTSSEVAERVRKAGDR
jgi:hypothetical protein